MPTFEIELDDGRKFHVDADSQDAAVSGLHAHVGLAQPAPAEKAAAQAPNGYLPFLNDMAHRVTQGATLGWNDEASAALRSIAPNTTYAKEKAIQDATEERAKKNTGAAGTAAEVLGGVGTGGMLARGGVTAMRAGQGLLTRLLAAPVEGAAYGAVAGAGENDKNRGAGAANGAMLGAAGGGLVAGGLAAAPAVGGFASNVAARINPEGAARAQVAQMLARSGRNVPDALNEIQGANAVGQPFAVADAFGNPAQRLLATVTNAPGAGRAQAVDFLHNRQAGQADRVGQIIDEGLGAGPTGRQASQALSQAASARAKPLYEQAWAHPIQPTERTGQFLNDPIARQGLQRGIEIQRLEALASGQPFNPADYTIAGYNRAASAPDVQMAVPNMRALDAVKKGIDDILEKYRDPTTGRLALDQRGRAIEQFRKAYVQHLDEINPHYAAARSAYAGPMQASEAIGRGRTAATRGRFEDNVSDYQGLRPHEQAGYRIGYADAANAGIDRSRPGANAAERFASNKSQNELRAMSQFADPDELLRRIERERIMSTTRQQATGGSRTVENLADIHDAGIDPRVLWNLAHGNFAHAAMNAGHGVLNQVSGNTEPVRNAMARMLLPLPGSPAPETLLPQLAELLQSRNVNQRRALAAVRGLLSGEGDYAGQQQ